MQSRSRRTSADDFAQPLLLQLNPFLVFEMVMRSLVPGYREPMRSPGPHDTRQDEQQAVPAYTRAEAAELVGLGEVELGRLWRALGFAEPAADEPGFSDADLDVLREVAALAADGLMDVDQVIRMVRPMGHLVSRLGAAQVSALSGLNGDGPDQLTTSAPAPAGVAADRLVPLLEGLVVHAWRRHVVAAASTVVPLRRLGEADGTYSVGFIDITRYTTLSRRIRWTDLALLLDRFEGCVFDRVGEAGGQVVKTLGDEVLFVARDPAIAAEIVLSVLDAARDDQALPSVHAGLAYGPVLERAGDVFGPTVNLASRVTDLARSGTVLVDGGFRTKIEDDDRFRVQRRARRPVRGYNHLVTYRLTRAC